MPGPATTPSTWATNANHAAGSDPWSGQPSKVEPSAGEKQVGFVPNMKPPAEWLNWLLNNFGAWLAYLATWIDEANDEIVYPVNKARTVIVPIINAHSQLDTGALEWVPSGTGRVSTVAAADMFIGLNDILPSGAVVTAIDLMCKPGAARSGGSRITLSYYVYTMTWTGTPPTPPASAGIESEEDDGTTDDQVITLFPVDADLATIDKTKDYGIQIRAGAGSFNQDVAYALRIRFNDPGPRNF